MQVASFKWKLVFRSGPFAGQSLHLPDGRLSMGESAGCEVMVRLPEAPGRHCRLEVDEHGVRLLPLGVRGKVNGRRIKDGEVMLAAGQAVALGGVHFSVARAGENMGALQAVNGTGRWPGLGSHANYLFTACLLIGVIGVGVAFIQSLMLAALPDAQFNLADEQAAQRPEAAFAPGLPVYLLNRETGRALPRSTVPVAMQPPPALANAPTANTRLLSALFQSAGWFSEWLGLPELGRGWRIRPFDLRLPADIGEDYLMAMSQYYQVPLHLVRKLIWIESRGRHRGASGRVLTSPKGALGIMQLMPATARELGVDPLDVRDNIRGGLAYLAQLSRQYRGDWDKVFAAYNWGPGNLNLAIAQYGSNWRRALPKESANYLLRMRGQRTFFVTNHLKSFHQ